MHGMNRPGAGMLDTELRKSYLDVVHVARYGAALPAVSRAHASYVIQPCRSREDVFGDLEID
jgi:hypothetical protein